MTAPKKNQTTQPVAEHAQRREHITESPIYRRFREVMIRDGEPFKACSMAFEAGFRVEPDDLFLPCRILLAGFTDEAERALWIKLQARELKEADRALQHLARLEDIGWNSKRRSEEAAAARAAREKAEADRQAAIARTQARLDEEDAARDAAARRMRAEAVVDAERGRA